MLRTHFIAPMATRATRAGARMKVVGQTARPTQIACIPLTSQRYATFTHLARTAVPLPAVPKRL
jgi:hypothetical protein